MKKWLGCCALLLAVALSACAPKSKVDPRVQAAYLAGQRDAMARMQPPEGLNVKIVGPVAKPVIPWKADLTLAKAIIEAGYFVPNEPREIFVVRYGQWYRIDPLDLLEGEDIPLEPQDVVEIRP